MSRKIKLTLLLVTVWAALYVIQTAGESAPLFSASASPSNRPLPLAWSNSARPAVSVTSPSAAQPNPAPAAQVVKKSSACPGVYTVQKGDTLGGIASRCQVTIEHLKAANPVLLNPNRIYPGQQITIDGSQASTTIPALSLPAGSFAPGSSIQVDSTGFPPNVEVRIGIGLSTTGYRLLTSAATDDQGHLTTLVTIPAAARSGERAFILLATHSLPTVQGISASFQLSQ